MIREFFSRSLLTRNIWTLRQEFMWVGIFSMIANLLMLTPSIYMLQIYDRIMLSQSLLTLLAVTILLAWFFFIIALSEWLRSRLLVRAGMQFDAKLSSLVFRASFNAHLVKPGYQPSDALTDLANIRQFMTGNGVLAFFDAPWTPFYIMVVFILHPLLGWMSIVFVGIQLGMAWLNDRVTASSIEESNKAARDDSRLISTKLRNAETVDAMGMHGNLLSYWTNAHQNTIDKSSASIVVQQKQQSWTKFVRYIMQSLTLAAAALLVIRGELSAGAMIAANLLVSRALQPMDTMVATYKYFVQAKLAFKRLEELLISYGDLKEGTHSEPASGNFHVKNLSIKAANTEKEILKDVNIEFQEGHVIAIVGPSGSGKSTLARCLVGVWPTLSGEVLLGDVPIQEWDKKILGPCMGYLPQDVELMEGSIADNISRFGEADSEKIIQAAKAVGIHEMILRLPKGYDMQIGESGGLLSGGQRQRIGLARAIYGEPSYVVLDEPNSNLDEAGERSLVEMVSQFKAKGKTVILITHKLNILSVVDDLLFLEAGRVLAQGPRNEVVNFMKQRNQK